jgi:3-hydroxyacyl-CoA dehydrogenase
MFLSRVGVIGDQALAEAVAKAGFTVVAEDALGSADLVLEAGTEAVFADLDERTPGHAILAATSARAGVTELGDVTSRPDLVVGLHFVAGTRLVEVVEGDDTAPATAQAAAALAQALRRQPVRCAESPGLIVNRVVLAAARADGADELFDADALARAREDEELAVFLLEAYGERFDPSEDDGPRSS